MTCETFTTNFLSNIGFINAYKKVYGLTGTLGSEKARYVLKDVYKVDLINVPQLRQKQYLEFPQLLALDEAKWQQEICSAALLEANKDRGTLIICETIEQANIIGEKLKAKYRPSAIKLYTMNNMNQEKKVEKILPGDIIIATNLAGRGTDIQTKAIEATGGLHVILTFMPNNQRVEDQAFGRTARQGKRGTGQMILNLMSLISFNKMNNPNEVKKQRDEIESQQLAEFQNNELKMIVKKDELFKKFCNFLNNEIRRDIREKNGTWKRIKDYISTTPTPTVYETNLLAAIEEQWAVFLHKIDEKIISIEKSEEKFDELIKRIWDDYQNSNVIKNSYYNIIIGNDLIVNEKDPNKAVLSYEKAVKSQKDFYGAAHVGLAWCSILMKKNDKKKERESLNETLKILSNEMAALNSMQVILQKSQQGFINSDLDKQLTVKATILGSYLNSVQNCLGVIKKSLRMIDIVKTNDIQEEVFFDLERNEKNEVDFKWEKNFEYKLTFNDLTTREDSGTFDQSIQTIDKAHSKVSVTGKLKSLFKELEEGFLSETYDKIRLRLNHVSLDRLKTFLNPNKDFEELTSEIAIEKLKGERSYLNAITSYSSSYLVDLKIIQSDNKTEPIEKLSVNDAIKAIEKRKDTSLRYYLNIKNANENEFNRYYLKHLNSTMQINFDKLDYTTASKYLSQIKTKNGINIEILITKGALLPIIENAIINSAKVCMVESTKYEAMKNGDLLNRIKNIKKDDLPFYIKIENLNSADALSLIKNFQDKLFKIQFNGINFSEFWEFLNNNNLEGSITICFQDLKRQNAIKFIEELRREGLEFCLEFMNLDYQQAKFIIKYAHLEAESIEISKVKNLAELFMNCAQPNYELAEFAAKGIEYTFDINEKRFIPWRSIIAVATLGTLQIIAGGVLIATGFGLSVGMGFISEGLSDMFTAYRAYSNRQFHWTDYCKQKAISLVISAISAGYGNLKDAAKGAGTITSEATKEGLEQAGSCLVQNGKTAGEQLLKTGKNLKSLVFKCTGVKAGEAVVREGLNSGVQYLTNLSLDLVKPQISESIQQRVKTVFCKHNLVCLLRKMYAIDAVSNSKTLQGKIEKIVTEAINPERSFFLKQWDSIGLPLLKGVLSSSEKYGSVVSMGIRIWGTLQGLNELRVIIDFIYDELVKKLTQIDKNTLTITLILHQNVKIPKEESRIICQKLKAFKIINENDNLISDYDNQREFKSKIDKFKLETNNDNVAKFMENFFLEYVKIELNTFNCIIKSVSDKLSDQIIRIIESQLVSPWSTYAVSAATDSLSKRIQHHYLVNKEQNSDSQNNDQKKYDELKKKQESNETLSEDDKKFLKSYGSYRTFGEQINYNARDYCIAYSQCEIIYNALNPKETKNNEEVSKQTQERADDVKNGKPASIAEMILLAKKNNVNLKVVDDKNYKRSQKEIDEGVEQVYIEKGSKDAQNVDQVGHAYYMDANGNFVEAKTKGNDCFYGAMSKILEKKGVNKTAEKLRDEAADVIQSNSNFQNVVAAER